MISLHDFWVSSARSIAAVKLPPIFCLAASMLWKLCPPRRHGIMMNDSLTSFVKNSLARSVLPQLIARWRASSNVWKLIEHLFLSNTLGLAFIQSGSPPCMTLQSFQEAARMFDEWWVIRFISIKGLLINRFALAIWRCMPCYDPPSINEVLCGWFTPPSELYAGTGGHLEDGGGSGRPGLHMSWHMKGCTQD